MDQEFYLDFLNYNGVPLAKTRISIDQRFAFLLSAVGINAVTVDTFAIDSD